jgi:hypothetical protein
MSTELKEQRTGAVDHEIVKQLVAGGHVQGSAKDGAVVGDLFLAVDRALSLTTAEFNSALSRLVKSGLVEKLVVRPTVRATVAGVCWNDQRKEKEAEAWKWIASRLQDGPVQTRTVFAAADAAGISRDILASAARDMDIVIVKGSPYGWLWQLPTFNATAATVADAEPFCFDRELK